MANKLHNILCAVNFFILKIRLLSPAVEKTPA